MTYYLLINEEAVEIGEVSFDKFYAYDEIGRASCRERV